MDKEIIMLYIYVLRIKEYNLQGIGLNIRLDKFGFYCIIYIFNLL